MSWLEVSYPIPHQYGTQKKYSLSRTSMLFRDVLLHISSLLGYGFRHDHFAYNVSGLSFPTIVTICELNQPLHRHLGHWHHTRVCVCVCVCVSVCVCVCARARVCVFAAAYGPGCTQTAHCFMSHSLRRWVHGAVGREQIGDSIVFAPSVSFS